MRENWNESKLLVAGDFNAQTSLAYKTCYFDGNQIIQDKNCNDNGERLKSFCRSNQICMIQTFFDHPIEDRITWHSKDGKTKRIIDYIFLEPYIQQYVVDCKVENSFDVDSDHRLLWKLLWQRRLSKRSEKETIYTRYRSIKRRGYSQIVQRPWSCSIGRCWWRWIGNRTKQQSNICTKLSSRINSTSESENTRQRKEQPWSLSN